MKKNIQGPVLTILSELLHQPKDMQVPMYLTFKAKVYTFKKCQLLVHIGIVSYR